MVDMVTLDGARTNIDAAEIALLRNKLRGRVILPDDPDYEGARRVWNGNVDRRPALIARCLDIRDVHHSVNFAQTHRLLIALRGGGHSAPGYGTNNGGVVIDLSPMKAISVDQTRRTVRAEVLF